MKKCRAWTAALALLSLLTLTACGGGQPEASPVPSATAAPVETPEPTAAATESPAPTDPPVPSPEPEASQAPAETQAPGHLVVIDAGHQGWWNSEHEPIGPGASQTKPKVSSGTYGPTSGVYEYQLTLEVSLKLQAELERRGYQVLMVRTTHDVNISNAERAAIANENGAEAFIRVHANGSEDTSVNGALTMCQTPDNPYNGALYDSCRSLSELVLDGLCTATGCKKLSIIETDTMSGINWCQVPVTIVEMGFMTNPQEDLNLNSDAYQDLIVTGIANGIDQYFA